MLGRSRGSRDTVPLRCPLAMFTRPRMQFFEFSSRLTEEAGDLGEAATSPPPPENLSHVPHGLKNTRVALAELSTILGLSFCCSNSSGER
jgi:hypothetical protein